MNDSLFEMWINSSRRTTDRISAYLSQRASRGWSYVFCGWSQVVLSRFLGGVHVCYFDFVFNLLCFVEAKTRFDVNFI